MAGCQGREFITQGHEGIFRGDGLWVMSICVCRNALDSVFILDGF